MRALLLPLAVLTAVGAGLVAGNLRLVTVPTEPGTITAPELAAPAAVSEPARPPEYCGTTRLAVVRRVTVRGEAEAMMAILPPSRWEAWPEVVRACHAVYGPLTSPPSWDSPPPTTGRTTDPPTGPT